MPVTELATDVIWIDGTLVPSDEASVHVLSHGMQRGSTVFDVLKVVHLDDGPAAFGLREHAARFMQSMELMAMTPDVGLAEIEQAVRVTVAANPGAEVVKLVAAWVEVPLRSLPVSTRPTIFVAALRQNAAADPGDTAATVTLMTASAPKLPSTMLPPGLKVAASYTIGVRERLAAAAAGFDDVVFRTVDGDLAEGSTQSLFVVRDGQVVVPPIDTVLDSITRRAVVDLARAAGIHVDVRPVSWSEVIDADELFLSSTNSHVLPVSRIDDLPFDAPGPVSEVLIAAMAEMLAGRHERSRRWLTNLG